MEKNKNIVSALVIILLLGGGVAFFYSNKISAPKNNDNVAVDIDSTTTGAVVSSTKSDSLGEYLTDAKGMTLYIFKDDKRLQSNCVASCLKQWPAFTYNNTNLASATDNLSKNISIIKKNDGTYQYVYTALPLYYYVGDKNPGDVSGNGLNDGKWSIVSVTK